MSLDLPAFNTIEPANIRNAIQQIITQHRQKIETLLAQTHSYTWDNFMRPLENLGDELNKTWSPISHLHAVCESDALRKAYNETLPLLTEYQTEQAQNEHLFNATNHIKNHSEFTRLNPAQQKIIHNDLRDFKLAGVHLADKEKKRFSELQQKLSQLSTTFAEHVLDATQSWVLHVTEIEKLAGLPQQSLDLAKEQAKERGLSGYIITLDFPSYSTAIRFLDNRELRKTLYEAYGTRASDQGPNANQFDNTPIMNELLALRHEMASLVGFPTFAHYSLATKMAKTPDDVLHFLNDLAARSKPLAEKEYQEVIAFAKKQDRLDTVEVWDIPYYSEKLRQSTFAFSQEDLRPYFPINKVLTGLFSLVNKLYGLRITQEKNINVWHPDVSFFLIHDEKNQLRGGFYIDLYARSHKRDGAWMDDCRTRRRLNDKDVQHPVAYLTCNFMPPVNNQPALLTHDDVLTLFHEFGHCLHHLLTQVDYPSVAGTNGVLWDAVEFPSQFMENFCWEKESLDLIAAHHQTNEPLPDDLFKKMIDAKHFQTGLQMIRQIEFSLFDFRLHLEYKPNTPDFVQAILNQVRQDVAVIHVPSFNRFQHSFSHIFAGGYAAGYYSYKWAEVLSSDAYAAFEENGIFDHKTGLSFMHDILEVGGVPDPMQAFIAFRGREPTIDALLRLSGVV